MSEPPKSRPEPEPGRRDPEADNPVYGDQWGRSGKQHPPQKSGVEPPPPDAAKNE